MRIVRQATFFLVLGLAAAGCAGHERKACREPGESAPLTPVSVKSALEGDSSELTTVEGALLVAEDGSMRLCTGLTSSRPPACREPSLAVEGLRDLAGADRVDEAGGVRWVESARMGGVVVANDTAHVVFACRTRDIVEYFRERTGETLTLNTFISNEDQDAVDFASLPELLGPELREKYGFFSIRVSLRNETVERRGLPETRPDERGIRWTREDGDWLAIKEYAPDVTVIWLAGKKRRVDERWERLDGILSDFH